MVVAIGCVGVLAVMVFGLGFLVSMARRRLRIGAGCPEDPANPLHKRIRAHANTCEYAPMLAVLMLYLGSQGAGPGIQALMLAVTAARVMIVVGLLGGPTLARANPWRLVGAVTTYVGGLGLAVATIASLWR